MNATAPPPSKPAIGRGRRPLESGDPWSRGTHGLRCAPTNPHDVQSTIEFHLRDATELDY
jgi:hypothetical protein